MSQTLKTKKKIVPNLKKKKHFFISGKTERNNGGISPKLTPFREFLDGNEVKIPPEEKKARRKEIKTRKKLKNNNQVHY